MSRMSRMTVAMCHDIITDVMLTVRCSHLYWGQPGPCRAKQWALGSDERQEREPEQSREECGVTRAHSAPHSGDYWTMGHISAFRNRWLISQDNSRIMNQFRPCRNESSCLCLVTQTPLRPGAGLDSGQWPAQLNTASGASSGVTGPSSHNPSHWHSQKWITPATSGTMVTQSDI